MVEQFVGKVIKQGNSKMVTIPAPIVDFLKIKVDDLVDIKVSKKKGDRNGARKS